MSMLLIQIHIGEKVKKRKKGKEKSEAETNEHEEQSRKVQIMSTSILVMAQEIRNTTGANRTCSNKRGIKNKYSGSQKLPAMTRKKQRGIGKDPYIIEVDR